MRDQLAAAREETEADPELHDLAREEIIERTEQQEAHLVEALRVLLLPRDPNDDRNVIIEIRAGAGGEEAALFAADLLPHVQPLRRAAPLEDRVADAPTRPASAACAR